MRDEKERVILSKKEFARLEELERLISGSLSPSEVQIYSMEIKQLVRKGRMRVENNIT
jgi:hypothetical protein